MRDKERTDWFGLAALAAQLAIALRLRLTAWPEITTPAYLWSRGMLLYRDIHFIHTPAMIGLLALVFRLLGPTTLALRVLVLPAALWAHWTLLSRTRDGTLLQRTASSVFFLALFYVWQGNSVWPSPMIAALALPLVSALDEEKVVRAGLLIGLAIVLKQTAAYGLAAVVITRILSRRSSRNTGKLAAAATVPYAIFLAAFAAAGAGREFVEWTLVAPFVMARAIANHPGFAVWAPVAVAVIPLAASIRRPPARWALAVGSGFALMALPRFAYLQIVAAVPCMAYGAHLWMRAPGRRPFRQVAAAFTWTIGLSTAVILAAGEPWNGTVEYWNDDPAFNRLVERIRRMPPGPVHSLIWPNLLPRTGRMPPARLYAMPWIYYFPGLDPIGDPILAASAAPDAITVTPYFPHTDSERLGPYSIWRGDSGWQRFLSRLQIARNR